MATSSFSVAGLCWGAALVTICAIAVPSLVLSAYAVSKIHAPPARSGMAGWKRYEYIAGSRLVMGEAVTSFHSSQGEIECRTGTRVWSLMDTLEYASEPDAMAAPVVKPVSLTVNELHVRALNGTQEASCEVSNDGVDFFNSIACDASTKFCKVHGSSCASCAAPWTNGMTIYKLKSNSYDIAAFSVQEDGVQLALERGTTNTVRTVERSQFVVPINGASAHIVADPTTLHFRMVDDDARRPETAYQPSTEALVFFDAR